MSDRSSTLDYESGCNVHDDDIGSGDYSYDGGDNLGLTIMTGEAVMEVMVLEVMAMVVVVMLRVMAVVMESVMEVVVLAMEVDRGEGSGDLWFQEHGFALK